MYMCVFCPSQYKTGCKIDLLTSARPNPNTRRPSGCRYQNEPGVLHGDIIHADLCCNDGVTTKVDADIMTDLRVSLLSR